MQAKAFPAMWRGTTAGVLCCALAAPVAKAAQQANSMSTSMEQQPSARINRSSQSLAAVEPGADQLSTDRFKLHRPEHRRGETLTESQRVLLVLDRFTYGPRPGEVARVQAMGLQKWLLQQLNPQSLDDAELDERLAAYPAMQLSLDRLFQQFPSNDEVRAQVNGRMTSADWGDATAHALDAHLEAELRKRLEDKKQEKDDGAVQGKLVAMSEDMQDQPPSLPMAPDAILALQPDARFKQLCHMSNPQLNELDHELGHELGPDAPAALLAGMTPEQQEAILALRGPARLLYEEEADTKLLRDIYSNRQLQEVMTDFWLNHFNIYIRKNEREPYFLSAYARDVIRPHALGSFENLLLATAESPAMMEYLDQAESIGAHSQFAEDRPGAKDVGLNENYGREVMELHTVGVNGGYTQADVISLAKMLTGWTINNGYRNGQPTYADYVPEKHEPGSETLMGHRFPDTGERQAYDALKMLAESPQCAHFISHELAVYFVSDNPPPALVARMADAFLKTHGDIRQVLIAMVNSPDFFTTATFHAKIKTPQQFVVSAVRATGADVEDPSALVRTVSDLGMPIYGHIAPDGYSMKNDAWDSTTQLVQRMNFSMALATNKVQGVRVNLDALLGADGEQMSVAQKQDALEQSILDEPMSSHSEELIAAEVAQTPQQQNAQLRQVGAIRGGGRFQTAALQPTALNAELDATPDTQAELVAGLTLGSPEFQRR